MLCYVANEIRTPARYSDIERGCYLPPGFEKLSFFRHKREHDGEIGLMIEIEFDCRFIQLRNQRFIRPMFVPQEDEIPDWELQELEQKHINPSQLELYFA